MTFVEALRLYLNQRVQIVLPTATFSGTLINVTSSLVTLLVEPPGYGVPEETNLRLSSIAYVRTFS